MSNLGMLARREGNLAGAYELHAESLAVKQALGDPRGIAFALWGLGLVAAAQGNSAEARGHYAEALASAAAFDDLWTLPYCLEAFAYLAATEESSERAAILLGVAECLREQTGAPLPEVWQGEHARAVAAGRDQIRAAAFEAAWATGRAMSLPAVVEFALAG